MAASKRLRNAGNVKTAPTEAQGGMAPTQNKRGVKGDTADGGGARFSAKTGAEITGVTEVLGGEAGVSGGANTFVARGASSKPDKTARGISALDSDLVPSGEDKRQTALATFTVASGAGAAGTFDATAENTGGTARVEVYSRDAVNLARDRGLVGVFYIVADGTAKSIALGAAFASVTVAVYAKKVDATGLRIGPAFGTRRTVAAHA
jgi:hypothetical protein